MLARDRGSEVTDVIPTFAPEMESAGRAIVCPTGRGSGEHMTMAAGTVAAAERPSLEPEVRRTAGRTNDKGRGKPSRVAGCQSDNGNYGGRGRAESAPINANERDSSHT